jgi:hypothetical protein
MKIYLAMAIDRNEEGRKEYETLAEELANSLYTAGVGSCSIFVPGTAYKGTPVSRRDQRYIIDINRLVLQYADILVVVYSPRVESWGVPYEMALARDTEGIPIYIYSPEVAKSLPIYLRAFAPDDHFLGSLNSLAEKVAKETDVEIQKA